MDAVMTALPYVRARAIQPSLPLFVDIAVEHWLLLAGTIFLSYKLILYAYNIFFHPLSKYPGPKLAQFSNLWEVYHLCSGRWPWDIEKVLKEYGDVVRIGPNSLVFLDPQALHDIHGPKRDLNETFIKTPLADGLGDDDDGLLWERNPEKHRRVAKTISPAFSGNSIRAKLPTMNEHIDSMVTKIGRYEAVDISIWLDWLCMDTAADLVWGWEMHQVKNMQSHGFLNAMVACNFMVVIVAAAKTYPFLYPLALVLAPWKVIRSLPMILREVRVQVRRRIKMRHDLKHSDYFEQLLPANKPSPTDDKQISHMLTVAAQLLIGGYDPTSVALYMGFYFLLKNAIALEQVRQEVREHFQRYEDIEAEQLRTLPFLNACLQETLRLSAVATHHSVPRISPGAMVDQEHIPKGVVCRTSLFAYSRSTRFFYDPKNFRLERWLPKDHRSYNAMFSTDDRSAHFPFIMGPRQCPGREVARHMFRLVIAKVLWSYDMEQLSKPLDLDRDFRAYSMWVKPELRMRLQPVQR